MYLHETIQKLLNLKQPAGMIINCLDRDDQKTAYVGMFSGVANPDSPNPKIKMKLPASNNGTTEFNLLGFEAEEEKDFQIVDKIFVINNGAKGELFYDRTEMFSENLR